MFCTLISGELITAARLSQKGPLGPLSFAGLSGFLLGWEVLVSLTPLGKDFGAGYEVPQEQLTM